jgi:alanine dehydrogenase
MAGQNELKKIGILGSRGQARGQLAAVRAAMPGIEEAFVFSPNEDNRKRYAGSMAQILGMKVTAVDTAREAVEGMDIVLTATNSNVPTFDGNWLSPGAHVCSLVSSNKGLHEAGFISEARREIDDTTLQRADVVVCNSIEQDKLDRTAIVWGAAEEGIISWDKVFDLGQVMRGEAGRTDDDQITFFKQNAFWGVGDQVIGKRLYEKAKARGIGIELDVDPFESTTDSRLEG